MDAEAHLSSEGKRKFWERAANESRWTSRDRGLHVKEAFDVNEEHGVNEKVEKSSKSDT